MDRRKRQRLISIDSTRTLASGGHDDHHQPAPQQQVPQAQQQQQQVPQAQQHVPASTQQLLQQLPEALLTQIVLQGGTQRHLHGVLTAVCQDWRKVLLQSTTQLSVGLTSASGAASLAAWLAKHAAGLEQLDMSTVGLFGRHCSNATRLQLFEALHQAAGGLGVAAAAAADDPATPTPPSTGRSSGAASQVLDSSQPEYGTSVSEQSDSEFGSDSEEYEPEFGGLFAGTAHLATPSPSGELLAAAAAAAAVALADEACPSSRHALRASRLSTMTPASVADTGPMELSFAEQHRPAGSPQQQHEHRQHTPPPLAPPQPQHLQLQQLSANMRLTPADCAAIASLPAPHLARLELQGSRTRRLGIDGVRALAAMTQLTSLKLQQLGIGDEATVLLVQGLPGLQLLSLSGNNIGPAGAAAIAQHCSKLQQLDLSINRVKGNGLVVLCAALQDLQELNLAGNPGFDAASLQQLHHLTALSALTISSSSLCNQGLAAIAAALPQLQVLDAANNRVSKVDVLSGLVSLTSLNFSRNPLQLNCSKVLAGLPLHSLALFDAAPARAVSHLAGRSLTAHATSLTLGSDPSLNPEGTEDALQLSKTRTCSVLFGALAEAGKLQVLSVPCTGLGDAQGKMLGKLGPTLKVLNVSYNCLSPAGLKVLKELTQLERLELRAMRPELTDDVITNISCCSRLTHLDLAHNDITSEGVKQLGTPALSRLQHLDLRNNAQVEKWSVLHAARHLTALTHLNLLEISDVSARAYPRPGARSAACAGAAGPPAAAGATATGATGAACATGQSPGSAGLRRGAAAAAGASGALGSPGCSAGGGGDGGASSERRPHADVWAALLDLEELLVEGQYAPNVGRGGRFMISAV